MKNDKILEAKKLGERKAEEFFDLIPEEARDAHVALTIEEISKLEKKQAKIKNKLKACKKPGVRTDMNVLASATVLGISEVATVGAAALLTEGTGFQGAAIAAGYFLGAGVGMGNVWALYTRPTTNAYRKFRRKMLNNSIDRINRKKAFQSAFLDKFESLRENEQESFEM